jgi:hypothetical protein
VIVLPQVTHGEHGVVGFRDLLPKAVALGLVAGLFALGDGLVERRLVFLLVGVKNLVHIDVDAHGTPLAG